MLNRQQRREHERKVNKMTNWLNSLSPEQEKAITYVIDEKVSKITHSIEQALDTSVAAAMIMKTDLNIKSIEDILSLASNYMTDSKQFLSKYGSDWIMKINEIKPKIKEECIKLLNENKNQAEAVKTLKEVFKEVPTKDLVNIFKETKEEWMKPKATQNKAESEEKEVSNVITHKEENKSVDKPIESKKEEMKNMFEVVKKEIILKGNYGTYKIDSNGVQAGDLKFKTDEDIKKYEEEQLKQFKNQMGELRAAFAYKG